MKREVLLVLILLSLIPIGSAEMTISLPERVYSVSDSFDFNVTIIPSSDVNDFLTANLVCLDNTILGSAEIYRVPVSLSSMTKKTVQISGRFDNFLVGNLLGDCHIEVEYRADTVSSADFKLARNIYVSLSTDEVILKPNDRVNVTVKSVKDNGQPVTKGFVELKIDGLKITSFNEVNQEISMIMISIPDDAPAGSYDISARVYEKNSDGEVTNEGEASRTFKIEQVIRKSDISISAQDVEPENEFVYTALLYDQTEQEIEENVNVSIFKPNGELFASSTVNSGEANSMKIEGTFMPGSWHIESNINGMSANRTFNVKEFEKASFSLAENILTVSNIGNVVYNDPIEVSIGKNVESVEVELGLGETKRYVLSAPDGNYEIGINNVDNEEVLGTSFLTGKAIAIDAEGEGFWSGSYVFIWIALITVGLLFAAQKYRKISNKSYYGKTPSSYPSPINVSNKSNIISEGSREECAVISLKLKNREEIERANGDAMSAVERALTRARDAKAKVYSDKEYKTIIFAPSLTNEKDNSMKAVAIAREIENILNEHNKRFGEKIMFGVGVHNGEMIVESASGKFKFNSIGSTIPSVKKIADSSSYGTAVSEMVHRRILGKVKSDRVEGTNYWKIRKIMDRDRHSDFIDKFVQRQKEGKGFFK